MSDPRFQRPERQQVIFRHASLDQLLPEDHQARSVWAFVERLDLSSLYEKIRAVEGHAGRSPIDPRILLALWILATLDGVGSARKLSRLCTESMPYQWLCGSVTVNHHTLSDFRKHGQALDNLLTQTVAALMTEGLVELKQVAQDGTRIKASANSKSFRRRQKLRENLRAARKQMRRLNREREDDPGAGSKRESAARERAAKDRVERIERALKEAEELAEKRTDKESKEKVRASETDPEARIMKFADRGFMPGYNCQFAVDTDSQIIVGTTVINIGGDKGQMGPMLEQLKKRYGRLPAQHLVDGGFTNKDDVVSATRDEVEVIMPPRKPTNPNRGRFEPAKGDPPEVSAWRRRMGTPAAQAAYKRRASTVECVNAITKNRGLGEILVRGLEKAGAVALIHAITHNVGRAIRLGSALVAT